MKNKIINIYLGVIFILVSGLLLAERIGFVDLHPVTENAGFLIFATGSVIFFLAYFLHGIRKWGWLFPALFCTALTVMIGVEQSGMEETNTAALLFTGWALPFFAGYIVSRKRWLLVLGIFLILFAAFLLFSAMKNGDWAGVAFFGMLVLSLLAAYFLLNRPWWLLLPVGGCASIGMVVMLETIIPHAAFPPLPVTHLRMGYYTWALILGLAITFWTLWLLRKTQPTWWAIYPAVGLLVLSGLAFLLGARFQIIGLAATLFLIGATLLLSQIHLQIFHRS